ETVIVLRLVRTSILIVNDPVAVTVRLARKVHRKAASGVEGGQNGRGHEDLDQMSRQHFGARTKLQLGARASYAKPIRCSPSSTIKMVAAGLLQRGNRSINVLSCWRGCHPCCR